MSTLLWKHLHAIILVSACSSSLSIHFWNLSLLTFFLNVNIPMGRYLY